MEKKRPLSPGEQELSVNSLTKRSNNSNISYNGNVDHNDKVDLAKALCVSVQVAAAAAAVAAAQSEETKEYAPSRFTVDDDGKRWRLCAGAAILNSSNHVLIGERMNIRDAWQTSQGGINDACIENDNKAETIEEASNRELYEGMGIHVDKQVVMLKTKKYKSEEGAESSSNISLRYEARGIGDWIAKAGYAGQELHWTIYRCVDGRGDEDPYLMCDLMGKNGKAAEFLRVKWAPIESVLANIWPAKRSTYEVLATMIKPIADDWEDKCKRLDLGGRWSREASLNTGVLESLINRGMSPDIAKKKSTESYIQEWSRKNSSATTWTVCTYEADGITNRRTLKYPVGEWEERYNQKQSTIFGVTTAGGYTSIHRRTAFMAEPDADESGIAHVTVSKTFLGKEEARRYKKQRHMVLKRIFWPESGELKDQSVSTEFFVRVPQDVPNASID